MKTGLQQAIEMLETGIRLRAQRHRRERPDATDQEVRDVVMAWLSDRPMAPDGDAIGRVTTWPRRG